MVDELAPLGLGFRSRLDRCGWPFCDCDRAMRPSTALDVMYPGSFCCCCHASDCMLEPRNISSSEPALSLRAREVVMVVDFWIPCFRLVSSLPDSMWPEESDGLLHGIAEAERVISKACFKSGRSVAMDPAVIPSPTSTVLQRAKSVVRWRKSPLYPLSVVV